MHNFVARFRTTLLGKIKYQTLYQYNKISYCCGNKGNYSTSFPLKKYLVVSNIGISCRVDLQNLRSYSRTVDNSNLKNELNDLKATDTTETTTEVLTTVPSEEMTDYRLPTDIIPTHYDLYLYPDLTTDTGNFTGTVAITVSVEGTTEIVKLHSNGLTINTVTINDVAATYTLDPVHELLIITSSNGPISAGEAKISIEFSGSMENRIVGLYISSYTNEDGVERKMATSKFEPTYARQAYPCFDEPNMKANFTVHLLKPKDETYIALSNMPVQREEDVEDGVMVHFEESVRMSTYLTCFIVCDFTFTEDTLANGQQFRVYATPEQVSKTEYARVIGKSVIEYFIEYFGIDFPLPKLDMAAIPDFVSGAMEHWGLVTFRETALLYSTEISSSSNKQRVATVVSHELAHSWFGNLVTMDWWNDIWLNEGFATYIEYKGVNYAEPTWQMMDQFIVADLHPVLILDATLASHPIVQTVLTPDEITAIFDTISYNKGAAVLRMLEDAVGQANFKAGVTKYLKDHEFENAVTQDLWNAIQEIVLDDINITELMNTWTMQMGYPIIDVTSDGEDNYILKQRRYLTNPDAIDETVTPYSYKWMIPVTYITSDSSIPQYVWFNHTEDQITISKPDADWIKFNYNQVGYYRVNYETNDWERLTQHIATLSIADRAHLLEEVFRLAHSNDITYAIALNLSKYMKDETDFIPWNVMSTMMHELDVYLASSSVYPDFKIFVQEMVTNAYNSLTWEENTNDGHVKSRARMTVLNLACAMDHQNCLDQATQRFQEWLDNGQALSQDLRAIIYNYGVAGGTTANWEKLYDIFVQENDASEKLRLLHALTHSSDQSLLERLIDIAKTEEVVRGQDYFTLMQYIADNPVGTSIVWNYVREHWQDLVNRFGLNERYLGRMIPAITKTFTTTARLEEMQNFFAEYPDAGAGAAARLQALETVENNIKWLQNNKEVVEDWILDYVNQS